MLAQGSDDRPGARGRLQRGSQVNGPRGGQQLDAQDGGEVVHHAADLAARMPSH
jgi:hypothetical protein